MHPEAIENILFHGKEVEPSFNELKKRLISQVYYLLIMIQGKYLINLFTNYYKSTTLNIPPLKFKGCLGLRYF